MPVPRFVPRRSFWFLVLASSACAGPTVAPPTQAPPRIEAPPAVPEDGVGLDHPESDPTVVTHARDALACNDGWASPMRSTERCSSVLDAFMKTSFDGKDATLVRLAEDEDARVVALGAYGLTKSFAWRTDPKLAGRVLDALDRARPSDTAIVSALAEVAGLVDGARTGLTQRLVAAYAKIPGDDARADYLEGALRANRDAFFDVTVDLARNGARPALRLAALEALWSGTPAGKEPDVCALWAEKMEDADDLVAARSAGMAGKRTTPDACSSAFDRLVVVLDQRTRGTLTSPRWTAALLDTSDNPSLTAPQRRALVAIARRVATARANEQTARTLAIRAAANLDIAAGRALAQQLSRDPDLVVAAEARGVLAGTDPLESRR